MEKVCVIGLGFIGLPTACILASKGLQVIGVDLNKKAVDSINNGRSYLKEKGFQELVEKVVKNKKFKASLKPENADVFILCVQTPLEKNSKKTDLGFLKKAITSIIPFLKKGNLIIVESTVPPKTCTEFVIPALEENSLNARDYLIVHCPERVLPGKILEELENNDRIIGGVSKEAAEKAKKLYSCFVKGSIYLTDSNTAETAKLVENTYRDVNIAFANALAKACDALGLDVKEVIELANKHPRVKILNPGPGVGGHCIAVDPWFIVEKAFEETGIIKLSREINDSMPRYVVSQVESALNELKKSINGTRICVLGLSYKADVDDLRESPALKIIEELKEKNARLNFFDPYFLEKSSVKSLEDALKAECIVLATDHAQFKEIKAEDLKKTGVKAVIDGRNSWDKEKIKNLGIIYRGIGRK